LKITVSTLSLPLSLTTVSGSISPSSSAAVEQHGARRDQASLQGGRRGDQLERRAGRVEALDRSVGQRGIVLLRGQRAVLPLGDRPGEDRGVEGGARSHCQHLAVLGVHHHEGPRQAEGAEGPLGVGLEVGVDGETDVVSRLGGPALQLARGSPEGIHLDPVDACPAPEEAVVLVFDPRLADQIPLLEAGIAWLLQLLRGHLANVAEEMRGHGALPVLAGEDPLDADPREALLVLAQVEDLVGAQPLGQDHRAAHRLLLRLPDLLLDLPGGHPRDSLEPAHQRRALGTGLGQVLGLHLERHVGSVGDQHLAVAVEDVATRRLHPDLPHPVVVGQAQVLVAREHLQVPEPQEDHREDRDSERGQDRHPDGQ
jgi:hypothetical protein